MDVIDYAKRVGAELRRNYNNRDDDAVSLLLKRADQAVKQSGASKSDRQKFWRDVEESFNAGPLAFEKQANSSLHALMKIIEAAIEEGKSGS